MAVIQFPNSNAGVKNHTAPHIIQFAFEPADSIAFLEIGGQWLRVPLWLWCEWGGGSHANVIRDYGLTKYPAPVVEEFALDSIELEARALRRYYRRKGDQHYYNMFGDLDRSVLQIEQLQMFERGILYGREKWEWIAERLSTKHGVNCGWRQAKALFEDAIDNLKQDQQRREIRRYAQLIRAMNAVSPVDTEADGNVSKAA